jgi:molybdopterin-guanine dinucleotide biosynthesis protein A
MIAGSSIAVALLAGGRSRRFGSDKSLYVPSGFTEPMWRLQLDKLMALGAEEVVVSVGAASAASPGFTVPGGVRVIADRVVDQGPLGGLAAVLSEIRAPQILVLGVDMPAVTAVALRRFLEACPEGRGLVPRLDGRWEPLLAIYPRNLLGLAEERLAGGELSMQGFVDDGVARGRIDAWPVSSADAGWFVNLNRPDSP